MSLSIIDFARAIGSSQYCSCSDKANNITRPLLVAGKVNKNAGNKTNVIAIIRTCEQMGDHKNYYCRALAVIRQP